MIEYVLGVIVAVFIGILAGYIGSYMILKRALDGGIFQDIILSSLNEALVNEDIQKNLYQFVGIMGKGFIDGTGLQRNVSRTNRKLDLSSVLMELASGFIQSRAGIPINPMQVLTQQGTPGTPESGTVEPLYK